jgi:hypothetical protein
VELEFRLVGRKNLDLGFIEKKERDLGDTNDISNILFTPLTKKHFKACTTSFMIRIWMKITTTKQYDDITNIHPNRGSNKYDGLRGWI